MFAKRLVPLALLAFGGVAIAGSVYVRYTGITYKQTVSVYRDGAYDTRVYAGQMNLTLDGAATNAFCIDLDHNVGSAYWADLEEVRGEPWCELAWIIDNYPVTDNTSSAIKQVAIWKAYYAADETITVTDSVSGVDINAEADALVAEAQCDVTNCTDPVTTDVDVYGASDGLVYADLYVEQGGAAVEGLSVFVELDGGALLDPADGWATTDGDGYATVVIELDGDTEVDVDFAFSGTTIYALVPDPATQQLLTVTSETCDFDDAGSFAVTPLGDPRTIGFWKHQAKIGHTGSGGRAHVDGATLESWLPISVLGADVTSLEDMYDLLWLKKADMDERAQQQCLATMLNIAYGELGWFSEADHDGDGTSDYFWELWTDVEGYYASGDFEAAKDICDGVNNL